MSVIDLGPRDPLREGLVLLCRELGRQTSVAELGDGLPLDQGRLPLSMVARALRRLQVTAQVSQHTLESMSGYLLPALILLNDGQTLLLMGVTEDMADVLVPRAGGGRQAIPLERLPEAYSGIAVFAKAQYRPDGREGGFAAALGEHWFFSELKRYRREYGEVALAAMFANLLAIASALFAMQVYDRVVPNQAVDTLWVLASGVLLAILFETALRITRAHMLDVMGKGIDLKLSAFLFERVLSIRLSAKPASIGAFSTQVREFETVREFFTSASAALISDLPFVAIFLLIIALIGGAIVFVPIVAILLIVVPGVACQGALARLSRQTLREGAVKNSILLEAIEHLETVKASRAEGRSLHLWQTLTAQLQGTALRTHSLVTRLSYAAALVQQLCYVAVVVVGVYMIGAGEMSVGALIACSLLASRAIAPLSQIAGILGRWQHTKVALEGLDQLMASPTERPLDRSFAHAEKLRGHYAMKELTLRHGDGPAVVDIDSLAIKAGEKIAVLGGNGAGKSSLLRMLSGLVEPSSGQLLIDDISMAQVDPADRRQAIGYLPQDVALLHGTLRDNLNLASGAVSDAEMFEALDAVGLGPFVRAHPTGLDMPVLGNDSFSGGQRQAIGLARVLLLDPAIVLLDEPTAAFDQASEEGLIEYMRNWLGERTLVLSTHKKNMLALVSRAVVLKQGRIIMDGPIDTVVMGNQVQTRAIAGGPHAV